MSTLADPVRRVLHVVDRAGGGVPLAVATYIHNSPDGFEHHILCPFDGDAAPQAWTDVPATLHVLHDGAARRIHQVRRLAQSLNVHVIHAHSSFSGVYARLAMSRRHTRLVHTPHCYSFERTDIRVSSRFLYRTIEQLLGWNTTLVAACSPGERRIAEQMRSTAGRTALIPNVASIPGGRVEPTTGLPKRVGMIGRVTAQKDPHYFRTLVTRLRDHLPNLQAIWIGEGDPSAMDMLNRADIEVAGWRTGSSLTEAIDSLDLYLHTAAWEGFPLALLDAHIRGIPTLVRPIAAFGSIPEQLTTARGLDGLIDASRSLDTYTAWADENRAQWSQQLANNTPPDQRAALKKVWQ